MVDAVERSQVGVQYKGWVHFACTGGVLWAEPTVGGWVGETERGGSRA